MTITYSKVGRTSGGKLHALALTRTACGLRLGVSARSYDYRYRLGELCQHQACQRAMASMLDDTAQPHQALETWAAAAGMSYDVAGMGHPLWFPKGVYCDHCGLRINDPSYGHVGRCESCVRLLCMPWDHWAVAVGATTAHVARWLIWQGWQTICAAAPSGTGFGLVARSDREVTCARCAEYAGVVAGGYTFAVELAS